MREGDSSDLDGLIFAAAAASELSGAVPHRPLTQPPMRRPMLGFRVGVDVGVSVLPLSESTDAVSERLLAATEARSDCGDRSVGGGSLPAVIVVVDRVGELDNSKLGETMLLRVRAG
jgi:hypothetical protein